VTLYELRAATAAEKDCIFEGYRTTVGPYVAHAWGWDEAFQREKFWEAHPLREFKVIQVDARFGGGLHVEEDAADLHIRMIFVLPEFQGQGIGSRLLTHIHCLAGHQEKGLCLKVIRANPAERLYHRLGFAVTGQDESSYDMRWA